MSQDNLSCLLYGPGDVRYENRDVPIIEDSHDVIIRVSYVGVCGSDAHFWTHGGVMRMVSEAEPIVMGHEASGIVHSVGDAVSSLRPGDHVAIEPGFSCRRCKQCKNGRYNLCPDMQFAADPPGNHGTLTKYFKIPEDFAYKLSGSLSLQDAVLVEPLGVAVHGARLAAIAPGQDVLIQGSGTIGLLAAATAKAFGAKRIFIADINKEKLDFAAKYLGCATFLSNIGSSPEAEAERFREENGLEEGVNVVLECTGVESSLQTGLYAIAAGGTVVQIGLGKPNLTVPILNMCEKETVLKTAWRYAPGDYEVALALLAARSVDVKPLISEIVPFDKAHEAWEKTKNGLGIKNIIEGVRD